MEVVLTGDNFDDITQQHEIVVVDFWAKWCVPCASFSKVFKDAAQKYSALCFATVDVERETQLAQDFNVRSIPHVIILRERIAVFAETGQIDSVVLFDLIEQVQRLDMQAVREQIGA